MIYRLALGEHAVPIETEAPLLAVAERLSAAGTPIMFDLTVDDTGESLAAGVIHEESDSDIELSAHPDAGSIRVTAPAAQLAGGAHLFHLAHLVLEQRMQEASGQTTVHCATVVSPEGSAVLLLGKSGAGKTTVAYRLCREHQFGLVGNDLCVLTLADDRPQAVTGTAYFTLRRASILRSVPELAGLWPSPTGDPWLEKAALPARTLGIGLATGTHPIQGAFLVHVDETEGLRGPWVYGDALAVRLYIHELFSRHIRAVTTPFLVGTTNSFAGYVPSFDSERAHMQRMRLIRSLFDAVHVQYLSGPAAAAAARIAEAIP